MTTSLRHEPTKPNEVNKPEREQEQTKFARPDEQSMVKLENMSQKNDNREFTQRPITMARPSHNVNLQTMLHLQPNCKQTKQSKHCQRDFG